MPLNHIPIGKRVFVSVDEPKKKEDLNKTAGGIILAPIEGENRPTTGTVAYVGQKVEYVKPGDRVYIGQNYPDPTDVEGEKFLIMMEEGIISILPNPN